MGGGGGQSRSRFRSAHFVGEMSPRLLAGRRVRAPEGASLKTVNYSSVFRQQCLQGSAVDAVLLILHFFLFRSPSSASLGSSPHLPPAFPSSFITFFHSPSSPSSSIFSVVYLFHPLLSSVLLPAPSTLFFLFLPRSFSFCLELLCSSFSISFFFFTTSASGCSPRPPSIPMFFFSFYSFNSFSITSPSSFPASTYSTPPTLLFPFHLLLTSSFSSLRDGNYH